MSEVYKYVTNDIKDTLDVKIQACIWKLFDSLHIKKADGKTPIRIIFQRNEEYNTLDKKSAPFYMITNKNPFMRYAVHLDGVAFTFPRDKVVVKIVYDKDLNANVMSYAEGK